MRDDAASNPLSFVVAGSLIIGIIGVALVTTGNIGSSGATASSVAANRELQADGLLSVLVDSPADGSGKLTLKAGGPTLDIATFRTLQLTKTTDDPTLLWHYDTARAGLGATSVDFHIRSYPTLKAVRDNLGSTQDNYLEVVYIGHAGSKLQGGQPTIGAPVCKTTTWDNDSVRIEVPVKNTGSSTTQFQLVLKIDNGPGRAAELRDQTGLLTAGEQETVVFIVPNTDATRCEFGATPTKFSVSVYGLKKRLATADFESPSAVGAPAMASDSLNLLIAGMHAVGGSNLVVEYTAEEHDVLSWTLHDGADASTTAPVTTGCGGATVQCQGSFTVPKNGNKFTIPTPAVAAAVEHTLVVRHVNAGATSTQRVLIVPTSSTVQDFVQTTGSSSFSFDAAMPIEVDYIEQLMGKFDPSLQGPTGYATPVWQDLCNGIPGHDCNSWTDSGGDVFWDEKQVLTQNLPPRITYADPVACTGPPADLPDMIIVGSNVDHNAMTSGPFKNPLADWVACGGFLIVFGSPEASTQWLQPIFHIGAQSTLTGPISAPDTTHPLLRVPHELDFDSYNHHGRTWKYTGNADEHFTNIVNQDSEPITAISDAGDFGRGSVLVSNWLPYDLYGTGSGSSGEAGLHIMDNFMTQAYRDLFLDYGPQIPSDSPVLPAIRQSQVVLSSGPPGAGNPSYHPMCRGLHNGVDGKECHVDMTVLLYVF